MDIQKMIPTVVAVLVAMVVWKMALEKMVVKSFDDESI